MGQQLFTNNAASVLAADITAAATSLTLQAGDGGKFPSPAGGDDFLLTLFQRVGTSEINHEIVICTARAGDVLTIVRAHEGTQARAFNAGDFVELRLTAGAVLPMRAGSLASALNEAPPVTLASAASMTVGSARSNTINVTGTTTINAFDTAPAGAIRRLNFAGALTLTHNATSMKLIGAANITTGAGDSAEFLSLGAGNWQMQQYNRAGGEPVGTVPVNRGGTGSTTAANARTALGLGNVENKSSATIRGELTSTDVTDALTYKPVQMGTGVNQIGNVVKIGWSAGSKLLLTVDSTDFAHSWPINAATATAVAWSGVSGKPTTIAGFGITDDVLTYKGIFPVANIDTITGSGFYAQDNSGSTSALIVHNTLNSVGPLQQRFTHGGSYEFRNKTDSATWTPWKTVITSANISAFTAGMATKLATARTINGVAFDGSANITIADSTKAPIASPAFTGNGTITGHFTVEAGADNEVAIGTSANANIELGKAGRTTSGQPFIDFHSGVNSPDYDSRIIASGGDGTLAGGILNMQAADLQWNGWTLTRNADLANIGLGITGASPIVADINDPAMVSGMYYTNAQTLGTFPGAALGGFLLHKSYGTAGFQMLQHYASDDLYFRRRSNSAWAAWVKLRNESSVVGIAQGGTGATTDAGARTALGLGNVENKSSATIRSELTQVDVIGGLGWVPPWRGQFAAGIDASVQAVTNLRTVANPATGVGYGGGVRFRFGHANDSTGNFADIIDLSTYNDSSGGGVNSLYFNKGSQQMQHKFASAGATAWTTRTIAYTDSNISGSAASATTAGSTSYLTNVADYSWALATLPNSYIKGFQTSFVGPAAGEGSFPHYGGLMTFKPYGGSAGGTMQLLTPYSHAGSGNGDGQLKFRTGDYSANTFSAWRTIIDNLNISSYVAGGANSLHGMTPTSANVVSSICSRDTNGDVAARCWWGATFANTANDNWTWSGHSVAHYGMSLRGAWTIIGGFDGVVLGCGGYERLRTNSSGISVTGNIYASGDVTAFSDENIKTNWRPVAANFVTQWAGVKCGVFDRTDITATQAGLGAQSVREILPQVVQETTFGEGGETRLSLNYGAAAAVATVELAKSVVKLEAENAELRDLLAGLAKRIHALESQ